MLEKFLALLRKLFPVFMAKVDQKRRKRQREESLLKAREAGRTVTVPQLVKNLRNMGITAGDTLLVHSSMSKIGYLEGGPATVVKALLTVLGPEGNLLMPSSPVIGLAKDYMQKEPVFDLLNTPSRAGAITEYFRRMDGVKRSFHPLEPVCATGPFAAFFTGEHFGEPTPYSEKSPFYRVAEAGGKVLLIGVTLNQASSSLHLLDDLIQKKFPVYVADKYRAMMIDEEGQAYVMETKVHNPEYVTKRKCDDLLHMFHYEGALARAPFGYADALLFDAKLQLELMRSKFSEFGVSIYSPTGS